MLYKFRNGLLSIVSEHTPKPGNQKKSRHQTNWQLLFLWHALPWDPAPATDLPPPHPQVEQPPQAVASFESGVQI